ncbi:MAG: hypothetical protein SOH63_04300 [Olsenella sp.]
MQKDAKRERRSRHLLHVGIAFLAAAALVACAGFVQLEARKSESARLCSGILSTLDVTALAGEGETEDAGAFDPAALPVLQVEGVDVAGQLEVQGIGMRIPVAARGADSSLVPTIVEAREGELAICGRAYEPGEGTTLSSIESVPMGSDAVFKQVDGTTTTYKVVAAGVTDKEFNDNFDLLLYSQDAFGQKSWVGCMKAS